MVVTSANNPNSADNDNCNNGGNSANIEPSNSEQKSVHNDDTNNGDISDDGLHNIGERICGDELNHNFNKTIGSVNQRCVNDSTSASEVGGKCAKVFSQCSGNNNGNVNTTVHEPVQLGRQHTSSKNNTNRMQGDTSDTINDEDMDDDFIYIGRPFHDEDWSIGPNFLSMREGVRTFFRSVFIWKYSKNRDDLMAKILTHQTTDADFEKILKSMLIPHCTRCQYCTFLTCLTCTGGLMPPTPSPYASPNRFESKWQNLINNPMSSTLTEQQYNALYRDFKHADLPTRRSPVKERLAKLGDLIAEEMLKIVHTFTNEVFPTLVDEYLKLFEEMIKGLILLKNTGITLEDICSIGEESHENNSQQATGTTNMDSKLSSCRPYKAAEFEKLLLDELVKQEKTLRDITKSARNFPPDSIHACEDDPDDPPNSYLYFLLNCHNLPSCNIKEFGQILHVEKQMFLKHCLELLRDNDYFRCHSQSPSESENFNAAAESSSSKGPTKQDINEDEMYKMSVKIYNKSIYHVQLAILAMCRSMQNDEQGRKKLLPPTPDGKVERVLKISESKNLIKKSLSDYLKSSDRSVSSEDEVFIHASIHRDSTLQDGSTVKQSKEPYQEHQVMPSIKYENEKKYASGHKYALKFENENKQEFPLLKQKIVQQHSDAECADASRHTYKGHENTQNVVKTEFLSQNTQRYAGRTGITPEKIQDDDEKIVLPHVGGIKPYILDKPLFRKKKNDVRIICVINYNEPEIPHFEAIAFLKKMETEHGILHYPNCSKNTSLIKMDGPSFYLAVCCADCRQELAPPQKLEAFKSVSTNTHRSKLMSHIIGKCSASYYPVQCGSCSFFLCDPEAAEKQHLFVPFHSSAKGICASQLKSHVCETGSSDIEYAGCRSDAINNSKIHQIQKIILEGTKRCQPYGFLNELARCRSLPVLVRHKDNDFGDMENGNNKTARVNASLKFEDAVTDILNMWTYEMIDYEKGANSPHLRSQILNYRKSLSIFIKKDIREKLFYRHIFSVFDRAENNESPILENRALAQKSTLNCKIVRSRSCHSKLRHEATSATHRRPNYESLGYYNNIPKTGVGSPYLRPGTLDRKSIARPLSLHSELKQKSPGTQRRHRSYSFTESDFKEDFSTEMNAWKYELQKLQKGIESPDLRSQGLNRRNISRPLSLNSELKHNTSHGRRRSSCSYATESGFKDDSTQIKVWKNELLKLQKSAESPHLGYEAISRNNRARPPLSLHSKPQRRRSYSFTEFEHKEDLSTQINSWKNELQEHCVERPFLRCGANRINYTRANSMHSEKNNTTKAATHGPKSESFMNKFSAQINKSKLELLKLQRTLQIINHKNILRTRGNEPFEENHKSAAPHCEPEPAVNRDLELTAWEHELLKLQKNVDSPQIKPETLNQINNRAGALEEEPKHTTISHRPVSEVDDTVTELKTWNLKLRKLERDATSPHLQGKKIFPKMKTRAYSLHTEPERPTTLSRNRPKSESVLDDFSRELESWNHKLLTLEEDARYPQPETLHRKNLAKSHSLSSEAKYNTGDIARRHTPMGPIHTPSVPNITRISSQNKSPVRRYSGSPRQLPATPNTRNARRHSHYETTGNFVNLLSDRRTTRLSTHNVSDTASTSNYGSADQGFIHPPNEGTDGFLRPDEGAARARFLSQ